MSILVDPSSIHLRHLLRPLLVGCKRKKKKKRKNEEEKSPTSRIGPDPILLPPSNHVFPFPFLLFPDKRFREKAHAEFHKKKKKPVLKTVCGARLGSLWYGSRRGSGRGLYTIRFSTAQGPAYLLSPTSKGSDPSRSVTSTTDSKSLAHRFIVVFGLSVRWRELDPEFGG